MIIVLVGPAGAGKSTVGRALADAIGWRFYDADDLHSATNIEKMRRGKPLDEGDREPWLARVRALMAGVSARSEDAVLACSALRERYRAAMSDGLEDIRFVMLEADRALLERRFVARPAHFAGTALLDSQLDDLERPERALTLSAAQSVDALVEQIRKAFSLQRAAGRSGC